MIGGFEFLGPENKDTSTATTTSGTQATELVYDPEAKAYVRRTIASTEFSKEAAAADARRSAEYMMRTLLEQNAPGIASASRGAGGYDSTTEKQLQNDLAARTAAAGSNVILDNIARYQQIRQGEIQTATGLLAKTTGTKVDTTSAVDTKVEERSAGALWDSLNPDAVAGGRYSGAGAQQGTGAGGLESTKTGSNPNAAVGTVICNQLFRDGHISQITYDADILYVADNISPITIRGYRFLAVPFVSAMRTNKTLYAIGKYFGLNWCNHCAGQKNILGYLMITAGVAGCYTLGLVVRETPYMHLWAEENTDGR